MSQTYQPKQRKRNRTHGFLKRSSSPGGKNTLLPKNEKRKKKAFSINKQQNKPQGLFCYNRE